MENVVKGFLSLFILLLFFFLGMNILFATTNAKAADSFLNTVTQEISEADFSPTVIAEKRRDAVENNYFGDTIPEESRKLSVNDYKNWVKSLSDNQVKNYTGLYVEPIDMDNDGLVDMARIELKYHFKLPLINYDKIHIAKSVAR